ncbi:MAG: HTH domain-containing protein [Acidaminococcales bacterium]|nr:HTH domain-containing protein [Acidaminococcales bacterium]
MGKIPLTARQKKIAQIVETAGPITGDKIARRLEVTRAALRSDLAILVMSGILEARTRVGYFYTGKKSLTVFIEEIKDIRVRDVQDLPVVIGDTANAYGAMAAMLAENAGDVFVVTEKGDLAGGISRKDLLEAAAAGGKLASLPVRMVMTPLPDLAFVFACEPIVAAARKIAENDIDSLPVVEEIDAAQNKYKVIGRLGKTNITKLLLELAEGKEVPHHN